LDSDGYRDNSETEAKDIGGSFGYYPTEWMKLYLNSDYHDDDTRLPGALKKSDFDAGADRTDSVQPKDFADIDDYYVKCGTEIYFLDDSMVKVDASYRNRESLFFSSFAGGTFEGDTEIETMAFAPQLVFREQILGFQNNLILGFDYSKSEEDITNTSDFFGFVTKGNFDLEKKNYGYYVHEEFRLFERLSLSGGYRYDKGRFEFDPSTPDHTTLDENLFTGGLNLRFHGDSYMYFSYSRSFRYPVLDEIFSFFTNTIDTNLDAQTSDDYEIGFRYYFARSLYAHVNFFRLDTDDEIFFNPDPLIYANENFEDEIRRQGVEISLTKAFDIARLTGAYTYTDAEIRGGQFDGNDVPNVAKHKATLDTIFFLGERLTVALNGIYVGERPFVSDYANAFGDQDDYLVINGKFKYNWNQYTAFLDINNMFNEGYAEYGVLGGFPVEEAFYPSPKFNFFLGLSLDF
jgi:outer membrane receptor protein involved in Fe transport